MADEDPGVHRPLLQRVATRRTLLAGAATAAAGGAAVAIAGLAINGDGDSGSTGSDTTPGGANAATATASARAAELAKEIPDAKVRAAHLLRRAGFGGTAAQIEEFAALSREDAADRLLNFEAVDNGPLDARIAAANFNLSTPGAESITSGHSSPSRCNAGG